MHPFVSMWPQVRSLAANFGAFAWRLCFRRRWGGLLSPRLMYHHLRDVLEVATQVTTGG